MSNSQESVRSISVFVSYSHEDKASKDKLLKLLKESAQKRPHLSFWVDKQMAPGQSIDDEVRVALGSCDLFIALVSTDYISSPSCFIKEFQVAAGLEKTKALRIVPIILSLCEWKPHFGNVLCLPEDGLPISQWGDLEKAWHSVREGLNKAIDQIDDVRSRDNDRIKETRMADGLAGLEFKACLSGLAELLPPVKLHVEPGVWEAEYLQFEILANTNVTSRLDRDPVSRACLRIVHAEISSLFVAGISVEYSFIQVGANRLRLVQFPARAIAKTLGALPHLMIFDLRLNINQLGISVLQKCTHILVHCRISGSDGIERRVDVKFLSMPGSLRLGLHSLDGIAPGSSTHQLDVEHLSLGTSPYWLKIKIDPSAFGPRMTVEGSVSFGLYVTIPNASQDELRNICLLSSVFINDSRGVRIGNAFESDGIGNVKSPIARVIGYLNNVGLGPDHIPICRFGTNLASFMMSSSRSDGMPPFEVLVGIAYEGLSVDQVSLKRFAISANFLPVSTVGTASASASIPRYASVGGSRTFALKELEERSVALDIS